MRLLLDTHVLLWWDEGKELRPETIAIIKDAELVCVSAAVGWEVAIKRSIGKLRTKRTVAHAAEASAFVELPISLRHTELVAALPWHHRDPFDRMLVAQAKEEGLTLVTRDPVFAQYGIPILRA